MHHASYPPPRRVDSRPVILPAQPAQSTQLTVSGPDPTYRVPSSSSVPSVSTVNAEAGPSTSNSTPNISASQKRKSGTTNSKKRRANGAADDHDDQSGAGAATHTAKQRESKKKKAARACFHCQKAHLTCDDARPCQRCIKRGMSDKCTEGHRKKAKYLLDEAELDALKKGKPTQQGTSTPEAVQLPPPPPPAPEPFPPNELYFNLPLDQNYSFGSEAANLEYSSLSAILGLNSFSPDQPFLTSETPPSTTNAGFGQSFANAGWPADPQQQQQQALMGGYDVGYSSSQQQQQQNGAQGQYGGQLMYNESPTSVNIQNGQDQQMGMQRMPPENNPYPTPEMAYPSIQNQQAQQSQVQQQQPPPYIQPSPPVHAPPMHQHQHHQQKQISSQSQSPSQAQFQSPQNAQAPSLLSRTSNASAVSLVSPPASDSPHSTSSVTESGITNTTQWSAQPQSAGRPSENILPPSASQTQTQAQIQNQTTQDVYKTVTKAYDYTESYHFLMKFLPTRFDKNDILRVIRALAIYRPSIISLQSPMSEEDFIFMEKCLRRSLVELEKLISFSGTPTVVWRRTGEICLVGVEFCLLTEWKKEDLLTGRKYIYELFENQSVIEYWEKFASHAFENTTQSVFSHCVLLKPSGEPIPCTFCFSIRRDIFDLPSVVIGQWLPLM